MAVVNTPWVLDQIYINGVNYSTQASAGPLGFKCWSIYDTIIKEEEVQDYLRNVLEPLIIPGVSFGLFDNASNQKTLGARLAMEEVFEGRYCYVPPYSPHLKPIERMFKLVKQYIQDNEDRAVQNPLGVINEAFTLQRGEPWRTFCVQPLEFIQAKYGLTCFVLLVSLT